MNNAKSVEEYIASLPEGQRPALEKLRKQIKAAAPEVVEGISWGVPVFKVNGKYVAGVAAYKKHLSFAPWGGWNGLISEQELEGYDHTAATIHFTPEKALPDGLVTKLVKAKIKQNEEKAKGNDTRR